jgi:hypothetical protein
MKLPLPLLSFAFLASAASAQMYPGPMDPDSGAVTDGTPQTTTADVARENIASVLPSDTSALEAQFPSETPGAEAATPATKDTTIDVGYGHFDIGGTTGDVWSLRVPYARKLDDRTTLEIGVPLSFTSLKQLTGHARIYGAGLNFGWARNVVTKADSKNFRWKLTPSAGLFFRDSNDLDQGSWVLGVGISSSAAWQVAPGWILNLGNSLSATAASAANGHPSPDRVTQATLVNGLQLIHPFGRLSWNAYITDTRFARDVAVDAYQTYATGFGFKLTQTRSFRVLALAESGSHYHAWTLTAASTWRF